MEKNTKNVYDIVLYILGILCALGVIVFGTLSITKTLEGALNYAEILLGVLMLVQGLQNLKKSKLTAIISFVAAAIIFSTALFIILA
ncbi:MAG: DUF3953 domain-containing protein [Clostridia bacterium]|nr:DUF3953 domain-containing protein [Clostridia bacterium]